VRVKRARRYKLLAYPDSIFSLYFIPAATYTWYQIGATCALEGDTK
jgi:hypothetical protein